ncbi:7TM diverse intracellular signaling domain-containing protein [Chitinophaga nivalis]|uniref:7TM-DISM receptor extracellular domain-containing protein n=1 Tax=Chitinophaga nivalis TaxID=2991709 RepID=A0ABT3IUY5_9BACT|nr:7TM diverse intracellular signaling domain-containing protein [Chitinophaga nivalis]MCW3462508.1 hypothetical protein [Chitinophaga nivalis]MCW3487801.1 hypothetical protein [Chitinophaga nivalis]
MKYLFTILLCTVVAWHTQAAHVLTNNQVLEIHAYDVLKDNQYSFGQIRTDTTLHFEPNHAFSVAAGGYYWIRLAITNPYPNTERYQLSLSLQLNYTLYSLDRTNGRWLQQQAGLASDRRQRDKGSIPCILPGGSTTTLYLKVALQDVQSYPYFINPTVILEKKLSLDSRENFLWYSWIIAGVLLVCFSCYNLYVYFQLRDPIYLYYLMIQSGAMLFITSFKHFFNLFLPAGIYHIRLNEDGSAYTYDLNAFFLHMGMLIILFGIIQLTRLYLQTRELLPSCDRLLQYLCYGFVVFELVPATVTITRLFYLDNYTLLFDNIFILLIALIIMAVCIVAYRHRIRAAKYFLLANIVPLFFVAGIAIYFIVYSAPSYLNHQSLLPEMAVFSQIFTFAVALIARMEVVTGELKTKELEITRLEADIVEATYKCKLIEQENEQIVLTIREEKDKNDVLQQKLEANQRELVGNSLYIHQKNKLLTDLKHQLQDIDQLYPHIKHPGLKSMKSSINEGLFLDAEWDKFKLHFEQVHPRFFEDLLLAHPALTRNEMRLYAYFHIQLSTKEIATLLNIAPASVRQAKARLNKKMNTQTPDTLLAPDEDL